MSATDLPVEYRAADLRAMRPVGRDPSVVVGRDALGNVFVTGDGNSVEVKLTVVVADTRLQARDAPALHNPYRGLDAFRETDSALFFGREDLITRLWTRFHALQRGQAPRLLPILGASGSGKSSLVRAGLLPELVREPIEGMRSPAVLVLRPGANPLQRLADVLARTLHGDGGAGSNGMALASDADLVHRTARVLGEVDRRVVVFVDQLEELFTECTSETARGAFLTTLARASAQPDGLVSVIFAMRNDFAGSLRAHEAFAVAVREQRFTVSQMSREQLVRAIEQPARVLGHPWPSGLVENLVLQCEGRSGALPLLQFALKRLWAEHLAGRLSETRWSSRLIEDFVVQVADTLFEGTGEARQRDAHQHIIRRAFVAMVQLGEGTADTRRMARLSEIVAQRETAEQVRVVLAPFAAPEARLVTASEIDGEPTYELAHEALIGSWDRLRAWLGNVASQADAAATRSDLRLRRRLRHAAEVWQLDRDAVWRPPELGLATALRDRDPGELSALDHEFLDASLAAWHAHRRGRRRIRVAIGALSVAFSFVVSILAVVAWRKAHEVERRVAESVQVYQDTGRQLLLDTQHPQEALPYLVAARENAELTGKTPSVALRLLFAQATQDFSATPPLRHRDAVWSAAFSPDGSRVVTASKDGTAQIWNAASGQAVMRLVGHRDRVKTAAFSPDGTRVVTASDDTTVRIWNAASGEPLGSLQHRDAVNSALFSPDGARVVTASNDGTAVVWELASDKRLPLPHGGVVNNAVFSPDGARVVTASNDHTAKLWDAASGDLLCTLSHKDIVLSAAFSPDNLRVVTASMDGTARIWATLPGRFAPIWNVPLCVALPAQPLGHRDGVFRAVFSPDGTRVVTAGNDGTARVWDAATGKPISPRLPHRALVWTAVFSPDGTRVVTASNDSTARIWDAATGKPLSPPLVHQGIVWSAAFSPDGARVVTASFDGTAQIWNADTLLPVTLAHRDTVQSAAFSPDGTRVVTASFDGTAQIWNAGSGTPLAPALSHMGKVQSAAFSPDGRYVVTASGDHTARIWDIATGKPRSPPLPHSGTVWSAAFNRDGTRVVTASDDHTARIWNVATGEPLPLLLQHSGTVWSAAFSPDGMRVVTASDDKTARIWDVATGRPLSPPLEHGGAVWSARFSPDGTRLVTAGDEVTARVWDATLGVPLLPALKHSGSINSAAFSPDGTRLVTTSGDFTARIWDARSHKLVAPPLQHGATVRSAQFSFDGTRVVTASDDGTAQVWEAASGRPLSPPLPHGRGVNLTAFSPDGTRVITASQDHTARIWYLPLASGTLREWRAAAKRFSPYVLDDGVLSLQ